MKFLLEFVSWCGRPVSLSEDCRSREATVPIEKEDRSLRSSEVEVRRNRRRKRGRVGSSSVFRQASAVANWKPSLYAISEEKIVMVEREKSLTKLKAERKSVSVPRSEVHLRSYHDDHNRRNSVQTIIPSISPVPFMF
ncbi:hypothetical protein SLE2022_395180 [Rubroshorea leprosula]